MGQGKLAHLGLLRIPPLTRMGLGKLSPGPTPDHPSNRALAPKPAHSHSAHPHPGPDAHRPRHNFHGHDQVKAHPSPLN
jgi:hypothetical protein